MTVLFHCRVEKRLLKKADEVAKRLGTSMPEMVRVFLTEIARTGKVPVNLNSRADKDIAAPWKQRATTLESFYDPAKT